MLFPGWPNGMAIDHNDRILYWADARVDKITAFNLNTKIRSVLARYVYSASFTNPFAS